MPEKVHPFKMMVIVILPLALFSQYTEREFALRLWSMGNFSFVLEDRETTLNLFALDENPADLIDYFYSDKLLEFISRFDYQNYNDKEVSYTSPMARYLQHMGSNLGIGFILNTRVIPHYNVVGITSKYHFRFLTNLKLKKFNFGYINRIRTLPNYFYHYIENEADILLNLNCLRLGVGYNRLVRYGYYSLWHPYQQSFFEIPFYFVSRFFNTQESFTIRYYSRRTDPWLTGELYGYDIRNIVVHNLSLYNTRLRIGINVNLRRLFEMSSTTTQNCEFINIIPGVSGSYRSLIIGFELPVLHSPYFPNFFIRNRIGIEFKATKLLTFRLGLAKTEDMEILIPESYINFYGMKPFLYGKPWPGISYSFGFEYSVSGISKLEWCTILFCPPYESYKLIQNLALRWQF